MQLVLVFLLLAISECLLVGVHAQEQARILQDSEDLAAYPDVWIVVLQPGTVGVKSVAKQAVQKGNGKLGYVFQHALQGFVYHGSDIDKIMADPNVKSVTRDSISKTTAQTVPTGIQRIFAANKKYMLKASSSCRCDAVVAVIDTGVDFGHPDLHVNTAMSIDCTKGSANQAKCIQGLGDDDHGHGTHVAGTVGAIDNGQGVVGVCPGAELWSIKVLNGRGIGYNSWILAGLDYVTQQASKVDVINMSLGGSGCDTTYCGAIQKAKNAGIAIAVAAGNENKPASQSTPACCSAVLAVSALSDSDGKAGGLGPRTCRDDKDDKIATFSNYGDAVDIAAPGDCILSTVPNGYAYYSGTSMASPHVAGALAVLASNDHNGRVNRFYNKLKATGNYNFVDKSGDTSKEPLLDMTRIPDANMVGSC